MRSLIASEREYVSDVDAALALYGDGGQLPQSVFSEDLMEMFQVPVQPAQREAQGREQVRERRIQEELDRWLNDSATLCRVDGKMETVLDFWRRQEQDKHYKYLPSVARIVFAVPVSSAQIERDFGVTGMTLTSQRVSIARHNLDMTAFLNRNRGFVDITQCAKIDASDVANHIPSNLIIDIQHDEIFDVERALAECFSAPLDEE